MAHISTQKRIGARLRAIRKQKGLTQEALEEKGISARYYSRIERGIANPTIATLDEICMKLDVQIEELFNFPTSKHSQSEDELAVITRINDLLNKKDKKSLRKLRIFVEQIL